MNQRAVSPQLAHALDGAELVILAHGCAPFADRLL
jgi:hypothetical protein